MATVHGALVRAERAQITSASAETVWRVWSDTTTWPQWNPEVRMIQFNGFFDDGVRGTMVTAKGKTRAVVLADVVQEESFTMVWRLAGLTKSYTRGTMRPLKDGTTRISQSVSLRGPFTALVGPMLRSRRARRFPALLKALAKKSESMERRWITQAAMAWQAPPVEELATA